MFHADNEFSLFCTHVNVNVDLPFFFFFVFGVLLYKQLVVSERSNEPTSKKVCSVCVIWTELFFSEYFALLISVVIFVHLLGLFLLFLPDGWVPWEWSSSVVVGEN